MTARRSELGVAIQQLREILGGLSQEAFARRLGITTRTAARWEAASKLSVQTLGRLRDLAAYTGGAWSLACFFEEKIREDLDLAEGVSVVANGALPGTAKERELVAELLRRYRSEDPAVQPIVAQIWAWIGEAGSARHRPPALQRAREALAERQEEEAEILGFIEQAQDYRE